MRVQLDSGAILEFDHQAGPDEIGAAAADYAAHAPQVQPRPQHEAWYGSQDMASNIHAIVAGESGGNPRAQTGSYYGVAQLGRSEVESTGGNWEAYKNASAQDQLAVAQKHWTQMGYKPEMGLMGLAMIQAAPAYLKKAASGWDGVVYQKGTAAWRSNPGWHGPDGEIRPSSITAYYAKHLPSHQYAHPIGPAQVQEGVGVGQGIAQAANAEAPAHQFWDTFKTPAVQPGISGGHGVSGTKAHPGSSTQDYGPPTGDAMTNEANAAQADYLKKTYGLTREQLLKEDPGFFLTDPIARAHELRSRMTVANFQKYAANTGKAIEDFIAPVTDQLQGAIPGASQAQSFLKSHPEILQTADTLGRAIDALPDSWQKNVGAGTLGAVAGQAGQIEKGKFLTDQISGFLNLPNEFASELGVLTSTDASPAQRAGAAFNFVAKALPGEAMAVVGKLRGLVKLKPRLAAPVSAIADTLEQAHHEWGARTDVGDVGVTWRGKPEPVTPQETPAPSQAPGVKEPWQMTRDEYRDHMIERYLADRPLLVDHVVDGQPTRLETTFDQALKDKLITKAWYDKNRYEYGSKNTQILGAKSVAKAWHSPAIEQALKEGKPVPQEVLADYPDLAKKYGAGTAERTTGVTPEASRPTETTGQTSPVAPQAPEMSAQSPQQGVLAQIGNTASDTEHTQAAKILGVTKDELKNQIASHAETVNTPADHSGVQASGVEAVQTPDGETAQTSHAPGPDGFRARTRVALDNNGALGIERAAAEHGITPEEATRIYQEEASSAPGTKLDDKLAQAEQKIKDRLAASRRRSGGMRSKRSGAVDTSILSDIVDGVHLFAVKAFRAGVKAATWMKSMVGRFGEPIRPYLAKAWENARLAKEELNNAFTGAMSTTRRIAPQIAHAAREFLGADSQGRSIWNGVKRFIDKAAGEEGFFDRVLYPTLAQDRLYGIRKSAAKAIQAIHGMKDFASEWHGSQAKAIVHASGGGDTVETLLEGGAHVDAKEAALNALQGVLDHNNDILTPEQYAENLRHPGWDAALKLYKDEVEPHLKENHERWGGTATDRLGDLHTYAPLVREAGQAAAGKRAALKVPKNMADTMASGTSVYTTDPESVSNTVVARTKGSARANLIQMINDSGLVRSATDADAYNPQPMQVGVNTYETSRVPSGQSAPVLVMKNGKQVYVPGRDSVLPRWLHKEVGQFLDRSNLPFDLRRTPLTGVWETLAKAKVMGVTEPIAHAINTLGYASSSQPLVGKGLGLLGNIPGMKTIASLIDRAGVDMNHIQAYRDTVELAKRGLLPTRAGLILGKPGGMRFAPKELVFGDKGLDLRNRIQLLRYAKDRTMDDARIYDFVSGAGTYTYGLDSALERNLKASRFSPFVTAAKTKAVGGAKAALGMSPLPHEGLSQIGPRIMQVATGGAVGYVGAWYAANRLLGNDPAKQRLGDIPVPKNVPVLGGKTIHMGFLMPYTHAGFVDTGVKAASDALRGGGDAQEAQNAFFAAIGNTLLKPVATSPVVTFASDVTGIAPYIEPDMTPLQTGKTLGPSLPNLETAIVKALPFGPAAADMGYVPRADWIEKRAGTDQDKLAQGLLDVLTPGLATESPSTPKSGLTRYQRDTLDRLTKKQQSTGFDSLTDDEKQNYGDLLQLRGEVQAQQPKLPKGSVKDPAFRSYMNQRRLNESGGVLKPRRKVGAMH